MSLTLGKKIWKKTKYVSSTQTSKCLQISEAELLQSVNKKNFVIEGIRQITLPPKALFLNKKDLAFCFQMQGKSNGKLITHTLKIGLLQV